MSPETKIERQLVHFSGHVQGVGFRYTTHEVASRYEVTGYVRNLPDSRVELVVEGTAKEIRTLLSEIRLQMNHFIDDQTCQKLPPTGEFTQFEIRY